MKYLDLEQLNLKVGDKITTIATPDFWGAFEQEGQVQQLQLVDITTSEIMNALGMSWGTRNIYIFIDNNGEYVSLCEAASMSNSENKAVYQNCYHNGFEGYQIVDLA